MPKKHTLNSKSYVQERIRQIKKDHLDSVKELCTNQSSKKERATDLQKKTMIKEGEAVFLPLTSWKLTTPIGKCIKNYDYNWMVEDLDQKRLNELTRQINRDAGRLMDLNMFSNETEKVRVGIEKFENKEYK